MTRLLWILLTSAVAIVVGQQQLMLRRPPRLIQHRPQPIHSGSAALDLSFSRPMERKSVRLTSRLLPPLNHRWLGETNPLRLVVDPDTPITTPLELQISGEDQRGQLLPPRQLWWEPRPWLLVNRIVEGGEQLQLLDRSEQWRPISPVWEGIQSLVPLGDGEGIAMVTRTNEGQERIWLQRLITSSVAKQQNGLLAPRAKEPQPLLDKDLLFAHLSSNLVGDLLVQTGGFTPGSERIELIRSDGSRRDLDILASGPLRLLPAGGGVVVPAYDGLALQPLVDTGQPAQMLPGSRELGAFCAASGRAVLIRHWPDYRRSIELVIPGLAPQELLLGEQAVLAVACNGSGKRVWAVLGRWQGDKGEHEIVLLDGDGNILKRKPLTPWTLKSGTPMQFDPVSHQLLVTLTHPAMNDGRVGLLNAETLDLNQVHPIAVQEAQWLMAG
ncbi:hypothetical protein KR100_07730 [Synechococcus sp. KORDI-100]|uniref:hypothetical protein n=1 Tax=Synechococcus sp. KORDI-100 TaxID=1280380 RepID=UPI0004E03CC8|nr:hypothetical protein [Synechococcus sp. KORDI-100]AII43250.1 hypothetical protein KR100_07730 [Synechococcus sp. KORDI-100]